MPQSVVRVASFTLKANARLGVLVTDAFVTQAFEPDVTPNPPPLKKFAAIWDTGATTTAISSKVVSECGLKPIGMVEVHHAGGATFTEVFLINIRLPNDVGFKNLRVTNATIPSADVLIGMDIISQGDFAITHGTGNTTFSFRYPSIQVIDFVEEGKRGQAPKPTGTSKVGRNDPCPCGSGKKYKRCCGR